MKKVFPAILFALLPLCASAAAPDVTAVRNYTLRALEECPDTKLDLKPVLTGGPAGFVMYEATMTSSDKDCGRHVFVLVSPVTQQVLLGTVFVLPPGNSVDARVAALPSQMLHSHIHLTGGSVDFPA